MTTDRRLLAGAVALVLVVAACGGSGSKTAAPTDNTGGNGGNTPTAVPTEAGGNGNQPTDAPISLEPGNASELEKLIPDKVLSITITKTSLDFGGIPWAAFGGGNNSNMEQVLKDNGKTLADVKFAIGMSETPGAGGMPTIIYAMQVKGLDAAKFVNAIDSSYDTNTELTVAGKKVHGTVANGFGTVTYLHDDVVFMVTAAEAEATDAVRQLP